MRDPLASIVGVGVVIGCLLCAVTVYAVDRLVFEPYRRQIRVMVQPVAVDIEAACPSCGHLWQVRGGAR